MIIELDDRLQAIADFVRLDSIAIDVGTDHGYLITYLVQNNICKQGIATDINEKPLAMAKKTIFEHGLEDKIAIILSDGLKEINGAGLDDILIAGMGGELIASILEATLWVKNPHYSFILQPMTKTEHLREYLYTHGYTIEGEKAVSSGKFVYTVIRAKYTGESKISTFFDCWIGKLEDSYDKSTILYFQKLQDRLNNMTRSAKTKEELETIKEVLLWLERRIKGDN